MKLLNLTFVLCLASLLLSCQTKSKPLTHIEASESIEDQVSEAIETEEDDIEEVDEVEYLEAAMNALEEEDYTMAAEKIMKAVSHIKGAIGEMDDPTNANNAVSKLIELATKLKIGTKMTADQLEEDLLKLDYFNDDDLEFEDEELDYEDQESED